MGGRRARKRRPPGTSLRTPTRGLNALGAGAPGIKRHGRSSVGARAMRCPCRRPVPPPAVPSPRPPGVRRGDARGGREGRGRPWGLRRGGRADGAPFAGRAASSERRERPISPGRRRAACTPVARWRQAILPGARLEWAYRASPARCRRPRSDAARACRAPACGHFAGTPARSLHARGAPRRRG